MSARTGIGCDTLQYTGRPGLPIQAAHAVDPPTLRAWSNAALNGSRGSRNPWIGLSISRCGLILLHVDCDSDGAGARRICQPHALPSAPGVIATQVFGCGLAGWSAKSAAGWGDPLAADRSRSLS